MPALPPSSSIPPTSAAVPTSSAAPISAAAPLRRPTLRRPALLLLAAALSALLLAPGAVRAEDPARPDDICEVYTDKIARPTELYLGQEVEIVLSVDGRCPQGTGGGGQADIVLVIDRSASQGDNGTWEPTIQAAGLFVDLIDFSRHQVGVVAFESSASLVQGLASDAAVVRAAIAGIPRPPFLGFATNITAGINTAQAELASARHRPESQPVLILLSDGQHNAPFGGAPGPAAEAAKAAGTLIVTIGLGVDASASAALRAMASRPELYFPAPTGDDLAGVYREIAGAVTGGGEITALAIYDVLGSQVEYVPGSAQPPPADFRSNTLIWRLPALPEGGWTARYRVRPLVAGRVLPNKLAYVDFTDADGAALTRLFPEPELIVREPPERQSIFLPLLMRGYCKPARPFDVALVLDTSSSMWGEKMARTRDAAVDFLRFLEMPPARAAVIAFNAEATVVQSLTGDRDAALAALDRLPRAEGTRIDRALTAAVAELTAGGGDPDRAPVVILLTDGRQEGGQEQAALNAGAAARRAGITVFTIGFGADVDPRLLGMVAGDPDRFYSAPTHEELAGIYRAIAGALPCSVAP